MSTLKELDDSLTRNPNDLTALISRSQKLISENKFEESLKDAERACILSNYSPESQLRRAIALDKLERKNEAKFLTKYFDLPGDYQYFVKPLREFEGEAVDPGPVNDADKTNVDAQQPLKVAPRVDWYQNGPKVYVSLFKKGLDLVYCDVKIEPHYLRVICPQLNFDWEQELTPGIVPEQSNYHTTPYKVEFVLQKIENSQWDSLVTNPHKATNHPTPLPTKMETVTDYKKFDSIDANSDSEDENDPNSFFQQLYKDSSPEVRRAMMKSYVESNGTALSTNWDEVSQKKVETSPPEHMEPKDWK